MALLEAENLKVSFETPSGPFAAVDGVSLCVRQGETLAIVGQSGCGKTVLCRNLMRLCTGSSRAQGSIRLEGRELLGLSEKAMRQIRGKQMAYLFQEPHLALSPSFPIGAQIAEAILVHEKAGKKQAKERAMRLIELVRLEPSCYFAYPHQLSGGMLQRAALSVALACQPKLLIADEPTTALDATVQAKVLQLLARLKRELGMAMLLITHDFGVAAQLADTIAVMRAGRFVEQGRAEEVLYAPAHPYTWSLLAALPGAEQMPREASAELLWQTPPLPSGAESQRFLADCSAPPAGTASPEQVPAKNAPASTLPGAEPVLGAAKKQECASKPAARLAQTVPETQGSSAPVSAACSAGFAGHVLQAGGAAHAPLDCAPSVQPEQFFAEQAPEEPSGAALPQNSRIDHPEQAGPQANAEAPSEPRFYLSQTHWAAIRRPQPPPVRVRQGKVVIEEGYLAESAPHI